MLNILQLNFSRLTIGVFVVGTTIGIIFAILSFQRSHKNLPSLDAYDRDVQMLFGIAEKLGYAKSSQLNYFKIKSSFSRVDRTTLVFSSPDTLEDFSRKVINLGLPRAYESAVTYGRLFKNDRFIRDINEISIRDIILTDPRSDNEFGLPDDISPNVMIWMVKPSSSIKLTIQFAQLPKPELAWYDKRTGKTVASPIVVLDLDRDVGLGRSF